MYLIPLSITVIFNAILMKLEVSIINSSTVLIAKSHINPTAPISNPDICVIGNSLTAAIVYTIL